MEHKGELTPLESRLVECAGAGDELDCAPTGATTGEFDQIDDWEDRKIRAEVLVALCTEEVSDWSVHPRRGLRLRGAYVAGKVDLSRAQLSECSLAFHTCYFDEDVVLQQASTTDLSFTSCALPSLYGDWFNSSASLQLIGTDLRQMSLDGASFRGNVVFSEVRLINPEGSDYALSADGLSARGVVLEDTQVEGEVRLLGADLSGSLICREGTKLINPKGYALNAYFMSARNVFLRDTHVEGEVRLVSANLSGELGCREGTRLINPKSRAQGYALSADGLSASSVFLQHTHVEGEVRLAGAALSHLECSKDTRLINPEGKALYAYSCQVEGLLIFELGKAAVGKVNFAYAQIGTLDDDLASWPDTYNLVGFTYNSLGGDQDLDRRLTWISKSEPFSPHVYTQLAEVYGRTGHEGFARQVAIGREKERGRQPDLSWGSRAWNRFLDLTVAYGYQPWRALVPLVVLFLLGWFLFTRPPAEEVMVHPSTKKVDPISAAACHEPYPCFSPSIYVLDTLLPIVDLHQERNWVPARPRPWGVWYEVLTWVLIGSGWILTTAVVAGIGSLWRRE
jgi:uncharacterized protein YjbI with pentapeptide repeats